MYSWSSASLASYSSAVVSLVDRIRSLQTRNFGQPATGTPSSSQITATGSGNAKFSTRSAVLPPAAIASTSSPASCRTLFWVKALATSLRSRLCSGGSIMMVPPSSLCGVILGTSASTAMARLNRRSPNTMRTSS